MYLFLSLIWASLNNELSKTATPCCKFQAAYTSIKIMNLFFDITALNVPSHLYTKKEQETEFFAFLNLLHLMICI